MFEKEVGLYKSGYVIVWPMRKQSCSPEVDHAAGLGGRLRTKRTQEVFLLGERGGGRKRRKMEASPQVS